MDARTLKLFREVIIKPNGIILVTADGFRQDDDAVFRPAGIERDQRQDHQ